MPENKYYIFGKEGGKRLSEEYDLPFLGQVPLIQSIREGGDSGTPAMMGNDENSKNAMLEFAGLTARNIAIRNAEKPATARLKSLV